MADFQKFNYQSMDELQQKITELKVDVSLTQDLAPLARHVRIGQHEAPNSIAILPMEGCDGLEDGSPSEETTRRYIRFARGGAGLIWFEACAVVPEGKANPRQLFITRDNVIDFKKLVQITLEEAHASMGENHRPVIILQLTHSGRYSKPKGKPQPIIGHHDPYLDAGSGVVAEQTPISDEELDRLQDNYVEAALLAQEAGFDGVDIKACHRYLISELLSGYTRQGKYGGSFENRTRFLLETLRKVRQATDPQFIIACRFNVFDAHPFPYGWGVDQTNSWQPDLTEPLQLVKLLKQAGVSLISNSAGNPYYSHPEVTRPFDAPVVGAEAPEEHPLESVARLFGFTRQIQKTEPDITVIGNGYSWLRQYFGNAAAINIHQGNVTMVGIGREAIAYPNAPKDLLTQGKLDERKVCIACSKCTQIMRDGGKTGCVIRDSEIYMPIYKEGRERASRK